jgi:sec-independent protein translocase protein TatB
MFGIGLPEMLLIMALALIVVGPDKLPDLARSLAKGLMDLKKTAEELKNSLDQENPLKEIRPDLEEAAKSLQHNLLDLPTTSANQSGKERSPAENAADAYQELMRHSPTANDDTSGQAAGKADAADKEPESSPPENQPGEARATGEQGPAPPSTGEHKP